jgi:hypothetical protein
VPSVRTWRRAAGTGGLGLAGVYAFEAAQYHRTAAKDFELEDPQARVRRTSPAWWRRSRLEDREGARRMGAEAHRRVCQDYLAPRRLTPGAGPDRPGRGLSVRSVPADGLDTPRAGQ